MGRYYLTWNKPQIITPKGENKDTPPQKKREKKRKTTHTHTGKKREEKRPIEACNRTSPAKQFTPEQGLESGCSTQATCRGLTECLVPLPCGWSTRPSNAFRSLAVTVHAGGQPESTHNGEALGLASGGAEVRARSGTLLKLSWPQNAKPQARKPIWGSSKQHPLLWKIPAKTSKAWRLRLQHQSMARPSRPHLHWGPAMCPCTHLSGSTILHSSAWVTHKHTHGD